MGGTNASGFPFLPFSPVSGDRMGKGGMSEEGETLMWRIMF